MNVNVGDRLVFAFPGSEEPRREGIVKQVHNDEWVTMEPVMDFAGYSLTDRDCPLSCVVEKISMATDKQKKYLIDLGYAGKPLDTMTLKEASAEIEYLKQWVGKQSCHYCGAPASGVGFFGEAACGECGGSD